MKYPDIAGMSAYITAMTIGWWNIATGNIARTVEDISLQGFLTVVLTSLSILYMLIKIYKSIRKKRK